MKFYLVLCYILINDTCLCLSLDGNEKTGAGAIWVLEFYCVYGVFGRVLLYVFVDTCFVDMCFVLNYFEFAYQMLDQSFKRYVYHNT